jgi:hypothetical protein
MQISTQRNCKHCKKLRKEVNQKATQGSFELDTLATTIMNGTDPRWIQWNVNPETMITLKCIGEPAVVLPQTVQTLEEFLVCLERAGHVRTKVFKHQCDRILDKPGKYTCSNTEIAVLQVKPPDATTTFGLDTLAKYVNISSLKDSTMAAVVHSCTYTPSSHTIGCHYPNIHFKSPTRIAPKEAVCLAVPGLSAPVPVAAAAPAAVPLGLF